MNVGRMMEFARQLVELDTRNKIQKRLNNIANRVQEIVNAPQEVAHQSNALTAVAELKAGLVSLNSEMSDSLRDFLVETGGDVFFFEEMADTIDQQIRSSGITAAVAKSFVDQLNSRRNKYIESLKAAESTLRSLKFQEYPIPPGQAEVSFRIPRRLIDNKPSKLAHEVWFVDFTVNIFSEAISGEKQEGQVAQLASSDPTVFITTAVHVAAGISLSVKLLVDAYAKYISILKMREQLKAIEMSTEALKELDGKADKNLESSIEKIIEKVLERRQQPDRGGLGRLSELKNGLRYVLKGLVAKFEFGFKVEVRCLPQGKEGMSEEQAAAATKIEEEIKSFQKVEYPELPETPLLKLPARRPRGAQADEKKARAAGGKRGRRNGRARHGGGVENGEAPEREESGDQDEGEIARA